MLLTGSQVSMALSSSIVFVFTSLLFFSGYVLQRQTVRGLQDVIRPRLPTPTPASPQVIPMAFGDPDAMIIVDNENRASTALRVNEEDTGGVPDWITIDLLNASTAGDEKPTEDMTTASREARYDESQSDRKLGGQKTLGDKEMRRRKSEEEARRVVKYEEGRRRLVSRRPLQLEHDAMDSL